MLIKDCPYCPKKIEAFTKKQIDHLLIIHIHSQHREMIQLKKAAK